MADGEGEVEAPPANITVQTRALRTPPFVPLSEQITNGRAWEEWLEGIEREFCYFKITDIEDKKDALIIYGGKDIARLAKSLPDPAGHALNDYTSLRTKLNDYFTPRRNKHHARYLFLKMRPSQHESTSAYAARLREKAHDCEFQATCNDRILEHLIQTVNNQALIQKAINRSFTLEQFLTEASQVEDTQLQIQEMRPDSSSVCMISKKSRGRGRGETRYKQSQQCGYCGLTGVHKPGRDCPAYGEICKKCGRKNHFKRVCTSNAQQDQERQSWRKGKKDRKQAKDKKKVKRTVEPDREGDSSSDDDFFTHSQSHMGKVFVIRKIGKLTKTIEVQIGEVDILIEPDCGADVNIMDEHQFKSFAKKCHKKPSLEPSQCRVTQLQDSLEVKGEFNTVVRNQTRGLPVKFIVVKGHINSPPLIGRDTLEDLGMVEIRADGSFRKPNGLGTEIPDQAKSVKHETTENIVKEFNHLFEGVGMIRDMKNNKEFPTTLPMKPEAVPVAQKPRQVPYYLQKPLKDLIDQGVKDDLYERVPTDEPITWCSPLVVQPKPKFRGVSQDKLEPSMIRASVDMRVPNKFMDRSRIIQGPIVEDFVYKFHDCVIFSKLDLRQGYQQLVLDQASREVTTFSTPWGNFRSKRLIFGAKTCQDLFDEAMFRIFGDIPRCLNQRDDILIGGRDVAEHNKTLRTVLQKASDFGITLNGGKCVFGTKNIEFYGYIFTNGQLKPTPDKVKAVKKCEPPKSKEEVRSFLGMTGFLSKFIPKYAILTAPLRELTRKESRFRWGKKEDDAFKDLKDHITNDSTVVFFDPRKSITVRVEASYNEGLSAGLFQETDRGMQPVHYISRSMTDTEKRYSQTEKDALAIRWAKQRFRMYLLGAPKFKIITAHKPLIPMFNKASTKLPPRIEKWVMDMQDVDFELVYQPGRDAADSLDFLSRHPLPGTGNDNTEKVVKSVVQTEHAVVIDRIRKETQKDRVLEKVRQRILNEDWEKYKQDPDVISFYGVRSELCVIDGLIFRLHRIIIPCCLQKTIVKAGHSLGHQGMSKTKQLLREKYWFPGMDNLVEAAVRECYECQVTTKSNFTEPVKSSPIPEKPWDVLSIDFGGPYPDGHYNLVAVDKRTRYPEVMKVSSKAAEPTIKALRTMFATHGVPRRIESDNGPPFNSHQMADFAKEEGFLHHRVTPLHPRANGEAENFMKILNKTEQIAHLEGRDSASAVQQLLIGYRSTPHPATGIPPYRALMNREIRIKLDYEDRCLRKPDINIQKKDEIFKWRVKDNAENKFTREHSFITGDYVIVRQRKVNKWTTAYEPSFYIINRIRGSAISARRINDGREITRDASHFKLVNAVVQNQQDSKEIQQTDNQEPDWREDMLARANPESSETNTNDNAIMIDNADDNRHMMSSRGDITPRQMMSSRGDITPRQMMSSRGDITPKDMMSMRDKTTNPASRTPQRDTQPRRDRPERNRRRPGYLEDYIC